MPRTDPSPVSSCPAIVESFLQEAALDNADTSPYNEMQEQEIIETFDPASDALFYGFVPATGNPSSLPHVHYVEGEQMSNEDTSQHMSREQIQFSQHSPTLPQEPEEANNPPDIDSEDWEFEFPYFTLDGDEDWLPLATLISPTDQDDMPSQGEVDIRDLEEITHVSDSEKDHWSDLE